MAWLGDLFVTHSNSEKCVFCTLRVIFRAIFKNFSFFPRLLWLFIVLSVPLPPKLTMFSKKSSIFIIISSQIFKKRNEFCHFLYVFMFLALDFLDFVFFVWDLKNVVEYGLWIFFWVCWMGFVVFYSMMLIIHAFHVCLSFFSIILCLCHVVHIVHMLKCLIEIFLCFCGLHGLLCA